MTPTAPRRIPPFYLLFLVFFVGVVGTYIHAQTISSVVFLPQTYYVGDRVEARVVVRGITINDIKLPDEKPRNSWVVVDSITPIQRADGVELRIQFQPFFRGTRELPRMDLGGVVLTGISPFVTTVFSETEEPELASIRDQLLLPGTYFQFALVLVFIIAVPAVVFLAGGWGKRWALAIRVRYRENRPYRAFSRSMRALQNELTDLDGKTFYIRLLDICREYLDGRLGGGFRSATTGEMDRALRRAAVDEDERARIVTLFTFGDLVKFAGKRVTLADRTGHMDEVTAVVTALQNARSRDVDS
ncbi:MAG: hypothetical protein WCY01_05505 [Alkalispirochaeta sp.]|jgi:hypothetical protein